MYRSAPVYEKILVGFDDRAEGLDAIHLAALFAQDDSELTVASVFPPAGSNLADGDRLAEDGAFLVEKARQAAPGARLKPRVLIERSPAKALQELGEAEGSDLIVLGSSHRGPLGRIHSGSTASRLLQGAPCAIAVAPRGFAQREDRDLREIAVGYDGLPESRAALDAAEELAAVHDALLKLLAVAEPPPLRSGYAITIATLTGALQEQLNEAVAGVPNGIDAGGEMLRGSAGPALIAWATEWLPNLLVVGSRGYGPVCSVLLGSVAINLMSEGPCPILVVPRPETPAKLLAASSAAGGESAG